jgi:hypothetical protein
MTYEDWLITLPLEKDPVGFAITCVYAIVDPAELVEVPRRRGTVVALSPFDGFMSVADTGVENVENGRSVMVLIDVGPALGFVTATEVPWEIL